MIHPTGGGTWDDAWDSRFKSAATQVAVLAQLRTATPPFNDGFNQFPFSSWLVLAWNPSTIPPASIRDVAGLTAELDPVKRTLTLGQGSLKILPDGSVVDLTAPVSGSPIYLKNKLCYIFLGTPDANSNAVLPYGVYVIANMLTDPSDGAITLILKDPKNLPEKVDVPPSASAAALLGTQDWPNQHPLEHLQRALTLTGLSSAYFDSSLTPSTYAGSLGHLNCSRFTHSTCVSTTGGGPTNASTFDGGFTSSFNVRQLIQDLETVWGGSVYWDETGVWKARAYNSGSPAVDAWTLDDIDELEMLDNWDETHFNQMNFSYASGAGGSAIDWLNTGRVPFGNVFSAPMLTLQDSNSIARYTTFFDGSGVYPTSFSSPWLNGLGPGLAFAGGVGAGATIQVWHATLFGFCGCRCPSGVNGAAATPPPAWAQLGANQHAYLRITGQNGGFFNQEIVRSSAVAFSNNGDADGAGNFFPFNSVFTLDQRGLFGTTPENWFLDITAAPAPDNQVCVEDITIPVLLYNNLIPRCKDGLPKVRATTVGIGKARIQVGDFVNLPKDRRVQVLGYNGGDPSLLWEVLRKETYIFDGHPRIQWLLGLVSNPITAAAANNVAVRNIWFLP
jgi:hypothetical protein